MIFPPVITECPCLDQTIKGVGCPDTRHRMTTSAPIGAVNIEGHTDTDGGATKDKEYTFGLKRKCFHFRIFFSLNSHAL